MIYSLSVQNVATAHTVKCQQCPMYDTVLVQVRQFALPTLTALSYGSKCTRAAFDMLFRQADISHHYRNLAI